MPTPYGRRAAGPKAAEASKLSEAACRRQRIPADRWADPRQQECCALLPGRRGAGAIEQAYETKRNSRDLIQALQSLLPLPIEMRR